MGWAIPAYFVTLVSRKVFLQNLGADYLGVDGLFANILSFLSMAELGIGSAITYSLYKPLALIDVDSMKSLMKLYKISYCIIGALIFIAGTILTPFLPYIVSNSSGLNNVTLIYFLFLFNTSVSYFFSYKSALIIADQKNIYSISTIIHGRSRYVQLRFCNYKKPKLSCVLGFTGG